MKVNSNLSYLSIFKHKRIYNEWKGQIESGKSPLYLEIPWITVVAKNYIEEYLMSRKISDTKIFEFGSGGSTLFFLKYADEVISVEHDEKWFLLVSQIIAEKKILKWQGRLLMPEQIADPVKNKFSPDNPHDYYSNGRVYSHFTFRKYASYIDKFSNNYFDIILIDGRSRTSCILHSLAKVRRGGMLVLDNAEREYYLSNKLISSAMFDLVLDYNSALTCTDSFTQTNIYIKR